MPLLSSIIIDGYRCFREPTEFTLAPLTLLYGWNNSGKSTLLRLLPLLSDSISEGAVAPLEFARVSGEQATLQDLFWKGDRRPEADFGIGLDLRFTDGQPLSRASMRIDFHRLARRPYIRAVQLYDANAELILDARHQPPAEGVTWPRAQRYLVRSQGAKRGKGQTIEFNGLMPSPSTPKPWSLLRELFLQLRGTVQWLRSVRGGMNRLYPDIGTAPQVLAADGSNVPAALRVEPEVLSAVSAWYEEHFQRRLQIREVPPSQYRVLLMPTQAASFDVDIVDSGQGMQQILPVLVAVERARRVAGEHPTLLAIEEPDSNLHDNAQRWLGEHLCTLAAMPKPPHIVLETHSQTLLLAIQLAVARRQVAPDRVRIYWISSLEDGRSSAREVRLDDTGQPQGQWPTEIFADSGQLARLLMKERLKKV